MEKLAEVNKKPGVVFAVDVETRGVNPKITSAVGGGGRGGHDWWFDVVW